MVSNDILIVAYKHLSIIHEINVRKWLEVIVATMELLIVAYKHHFSHLHALTTQVNIGVALGSC